MSVDRLNDSERALQMLAVFLTSPGDTLATFTPSEKRERLLTMAAGESHTFSVGAFVRIPREQRELHFTLSAESDQPDIGLELPWFAERVEVAIAGIKEIRDPN
jgi:hypothetical protein